MPRDLQDNENLRSGPESRYTPPARYYAATREELRRFFHALHARGGMADRYIDASCEEDRDRFIYVTESGAIPAAYGARALTIITAPGVTVTTGGHNKIWSMDDPRGTGFTTIFRDTIPENASRAVYEELERMRERAYEIDRAQYNQKTKEEIKAQQPERKMGVVKMLSAEISASFNPALIPATQDQVSTFNRLARDGKIEEHTMYGQRAPGTGRTILLDQHSFRTDFKSLALTFLARATDKDARVFVARRDCAVPSLHGSCAITILVPPGITVKTGGHNDVFTVPGLKP